GVQRWVKRYDGVDDRADFGVSLAVGPGSKRVYVTGIRDGGSHQNDYVTISYRTLNGSAAWTRIYDGPAGGKDRPEELDLSPDGSTDFVTIAYDASTGQRSWVAHHGTAGLTDFALDVAVDPLGARVFVTGVSWSGATSQTSDAVTVAYAA